MPIRAEDRLRYPKDWRAIRDRILARARHACERCGLAHGEWVLRSEQDAADRKPCQYADEAVDNYPPGWKPVLIVLTIAHLNHNPADCADDNLRAWCQLHHLRYDIEHHQRNAAKTRRRKKMNLELFEGA